MEFDALYDCYAERLLGWAARRAAPAEVEDLAQEAWLALYRALPGYRGESAFEAWLFGVARNVWRARARTRARLKRTSVAIALDEAPPAALVDMRTPEDLLGAGRALARVEAEARVRIGAQTWDRLVRYTLGDQDLDTLAEEAGVSAQALRSRLSRARRCLLSACPTALGR